MLLDGYCLWYMCDYTALHHIHCMKLFNTNFGVLIWKILHFCFSTYVTLSHKICAFRSIFVRWRSLVLSLNMTSVNERHVLWARLFLFVQFSADFHIYEWFWHLCIILILMLELWPVIVTQIFLATSVGIYYIQIVREDLRFCKKNKTFCFVNFSFWKILWLFFIPFANCNLNDTFWILLLSLKKNVWNLHSYFVKNSSFFIDIFLLSFIKLSDIRTFCKSADFFEMQDCAIYNKLRSLILFLN